MSSRQEWMATWLPQVVGWILSGVVAFSLLNARVTVLEDARVQHERRIQVLEDSIRQALSSILEELRELRRQRDANGRPQ